MRSTFVLLVVLSLLALVSCGKGNQGGETPGSPTAAATPAATPAGPQLASPTAGPPWVKELPGRAVSAKAGDVVWATVPKADDEMIEWFGPCKVDSVSAAGTASLKGEMDKAYPDVPGALILPPSPPPAFQAGDIVTLALFGMPKVGVVTALEGGKAKVKYNWVSSTKDEVVDAVAPLVPGKAPLSWVLYQGEGIVTSKYKGIVVAVEGAKTWVLAMSGHIVVKASQEVWPLALGKDYTVGQKVFVNYPCYVEATVKKVLEPGFRYQVELKTAAGKTEVKEYTFDDIVATM